jgi:hypothetical protein
MADYLSTGEVADLFGVEPWRIRRVFECGAIDEPGRLAGKRVIPRALLGEIAIGLEKRGWLPKPEAASA